MYAVGMACMALGTRVSIYLEMCCVAQVPGAWIGEPTLAVKIARNETREDQQKREEQETKKKKHARRK